MSRKRISIITPCWNEVDNVGECHLAVRRLFESTLSAYDFEHIFCDNASSDGTGERLRELARADKRVKVIVNSRNFGPFNSTFNGLMAATGDAVVVMLAADLQDPPALIVEFVKKWEEGFQVVYGVRSRREERLLMRFIRRRYYGLVSRFAEFPIPMNVGEFQLIDRIVVEALRRFEDYYPYIRGMIASCGFRSTGIEYTWRARRRGVSKNSLYHLVDQGLNGLFSFTKVPLRLAMLSGFLLSFASISYAFVNLALSLIYYRKLAPAGIPTLIVAIFFFSGAQLFMIGILGEYLGAIHAQVRKRPLVIEKERMNFE